MIVIFISRFILVAKCACCLC